MENKNTNPAPDAFSEESDPVNSEQLYSEAGNDLTLIRWMLSLTPSERLQVLQDTIYSIEKLKNAKKSYGI